MSARALLFAVLLTAVPLAASAQAPLVNGLGGPHDFGTECVGRNDDGSSALIDITGAFPGGLHFFSGTYTTLSVNENGNITFNGNLPTYTASPFPIASQPMIAPFWADVDTRRPDPGLFGCNIGDPGAGEAVIDPPCDPSNDTNGSLWWWWEPGRFVVTWDNVGYFDCHDDHRDSFQLILTAAADTTCGGTGMGVGGGNFDVEFRYNRCEWETGDASGGMGGFGGTQGQAGFDAGDSVNYIAIPGSLMPGIINLLCTTSNIGMPGVWHFGVRGGVVMCPDAGRDCTISGAMGVCAVGRTQCVMSGTMCQPVNMASHEVCDALDNDCNGMVDDGDGLCPPGNICDRGVCVPPCFEHSCATGLMCNTDGRCVDTACASVTCPTGQRCVGGTCVGACDGITCPLGQQCRLGRCVDACAGVICDADQVCEGGLCVPTCPCRACGASQECTPDGHCVDTGCGGITCPFGQVCQAGACVDACTGAVCPGMLMCTMGQCPDPSLPDGGITGPHDGGTGSHADGGGGGPHGGTHGGCCSVAGTSPATGGVLALFALLGVVALRRRRGA